MLTGSFTCVDAASSFCPVRTRMFDAAAEVPPAAASESPSGDKAKPTASDYYYWHGSHREKVARGDLAPMPVHTALAVEHVVVDAVQYKPVTKYSWCDNEKTVDIYVDWPNLNADAVTVQFTAGTVCAEIRESEKLVHRLHLKTSKGIDPAESKFRCKPSQLAIKLKKEPVEHWFDLEPKPTIDMSG